MSNLLTITQAADLISPSISTLRRDIKSGKVSVTTDKRGYQRIDPSELSRVYDIKKPTELDAQVNTNEPRQNGSMNSVDSPENSELNSVDSQIVSLLREQNNSLREQIAEEKAEKSKLLELADRLQKHADSLQKQNEQLMLPPPQKPNFSFWRLFRIRKGAE